MYSHVTFRCLVLVCTNNSKVTRAPFLTRIGPRSRQQGRRLLDNAAAQEDGLRQALLHQDGCRRRGGPQDGIQRAPGRWATLPPQVDPRQRLRGGWLLGDAAARRCRLEHGRIDKQPASQLRHRWWNCMGPFLFIGAPRLDADGQTTLHSMPVLPWGWCCGGAPKDLNSWRV